MSLDEVTKPDLLVDNDGRDVGEERMSEEISITRRENEIKKIDRVIKDHLRSKGRKYW